MPKFEIDLNKLPEEQNLPSSPEHTASKDFTRQQGENSTSRGKQGSIGDLTRHFATNPYYHQAQGESSRQQGSESCVVQRQPQEAHCSAFQPWKPAQPQEAPSTVGNTPNRAFRPWQAPREAQHYPEQSLLDEASCSQQQSQGDLHPHARIDNIQRALQFGIDELERLRPPVPPHTEHMVQQQPEERLLSHDEMTTVPTSDSQGEPNHNSSHKRKRDEASSTAVDAASQASNTDHTAQLTPRSKTRSEATKQQWADPASRNKLLKTRQTAEYREKLSDAAKKRWTNLAYREKQSEAAKKRRTDPAHRKKQSDAAKRRWTNPAYCKKQSDAAKKRWTNPEFQKKMSEKMSEKSKKLWEDPEYQKKMSEKSKKLWEDPEYQKKMSETSKKLWEDPEYQKKMSETSKKLWANPEHQKKMSETSKKLWANPEHQKKMSEKMSETSKKLWANLEYQKKMSETSKKLWANLEHQKKMSEKMSETSKKLWANLEYQKKMSEINAKREDEKLTKKYGEGSKKEAAKRLKASKKAWRAGTQQVAPDQPPSA